MATLLESCFLGPLLLSLVLRMQLWPWGRGRISLQQVHSGVIINGVCSFQVIVHWLKMTSSHRSHTVFALITVALQHNFMEACELPAVYSNREVLPCSDGLRWQPLWSFVPCGTIRVTEPVEQRGSHALWSRVTPAANEALADLGLCGCVD